MMIRSARPLRSDMLSRAYADVGNARMGILRAIQDLDPDMREDIARLQRMDRQLTDLAEHLRQRMIEECGREECA